MFESTGRRVCKRRVGFNVVSDICLGLLSDAVSCGAVSMGQEGAVNGSSHPAGRARVLSAVPQRS